jgi:hypothetical protein
MLPVLGTKGRTLSQISMKRDEWFFAISLGSLTVLAFTLPIAILMSY